MDYARMIDKLESLGAKPGIKRIKEALKELGRPDKAYKIIKVGGTNGKGSTAAFLSGILQAEGLKVGLYTSPHICSYMERYKINGRSISRKEFFNLLGMGLTYAETFGLTTFETLTLMAFVLFARKKCDFAVMEVGMGGRLDAVNVARECLSIITNVGLEHTQHLGKTVRSIAYEKAGIIKAGPVVTGAQYDALSVIKKRARKVRARCFVYGKDFDASHISVSETGTGFIYTGIYKDTIRLKTRMIGKHQAVNASIATASAEILGMRRKSIIRGITNTYVPGRVEYIRASMHARAKIILDVAHNPQGINALVNAIRGIKANRKICVFGVMKDKDYRRMLRILCNGVDAFIFTDIESSRCLEAKALVEEMGKMRQCKKPILFAGNSMETIRCIKTLAKEGKIRKDDMLVITGSFYVIGDLIKKGIKKVV